MRGGLEATQKQQNQHHRERDGAGQVPLRRDAHMRSHCAQQTRTEETEAPERVRAVHDAPAALMLDAICLEVHDEFDRTNAQPRGQQAQEQRQRSTRVSGERIEHRNHRHQHEQSRAMPHALDQPPGERQREERPTGHTDQAEAQFSLGEPHRTLQFRQAREEAAEREGVQEEGSEHLSVGRQSQAKSSNGWS